MNFKIEIYKDCPNLRRGNDGNFGLWSFGSGREGNEVSSLDEELKTLFLKEQDEAESLPSILCSMPNETLIFCNTDIVILKSDIIRSQPLFFGQTSTGYFVTDDLGAYQSDFGYFEIDNNALEEFTVSGLVYGPRTVYKEVYALQAGQVVVIKKHSFHRKQYFEFKPVANPKEYPGLKDFVREFDQVLTNVFGRMIASCSPAARWVVPLSGGHDSRIIINYLYKAGVKNVLCFSYGVPNNEQSIVSKMVAHAVGYEWDFVEYTEKKWEELHLNGLIDRYVDYAFNGVSTPHLQDFLAIYELSRKGLIKEGDVFVPGHALDFIAGSHLNMLDIKCPDKESAIDRVLKKNSQVPVNNREELSSPRITIGEIFDSVNVEPTYFQEYFNWQERQAKFIVNSIRAYEFFNFEYRLPFWDFEIVNFWLKVNPLQRAERKLFLASERAGILCDELKQIPFAGESSDKSKVSGKERVKKVLPEVIIQTFLRLTKRKVKLNEGLNTMYTLKAGSVKELLNPVTDFPEPILRHFRNLLGRYPFQMSYHFLSTLYSIRRLLSQKKNIK